MASGQVRSSTITGTVTDPSGAVVPEAIVTVTNEETEVAVRLITNAAGEFTVPYLGAGVYSVAVTAGGFQPFRKSGIATTVRADVALVTGTIATAVEVRADAAMLQTETATVQGSVNAGIIANSDYGMPANVQTLVAMHGTATIIQNFGGPIANLNSDTWRRKRESQLNHVRTCSTQLRR